MCKQSLLWWNCGQMQHRLVSTGRCKTDSEIPIKEMPGLVELPGVLSHQIFAGLLCVASDVRLIADVTLVNRPPLVCSLFECTVGVELHSGCKIYRILIIALRPV